MWHPPTARNQPGWPAAIIAGLIPMAFATLALANTHNRLERSFMFMLMIPAAALAGGALGGIARAVVATSRERSRSRVRTGLATFFKTWLALSGLNLAAGYTAAMIVAAVLPPPASMH